MRSDGTDHPTTIGDPAERIEVVGNRGGARRERAQRRKRLGVLGVAVVLLLGAIVGGGWYVVNSLFSIPDFEGTGEGSVVVQVQDGDTTRQIANELADRGVVESVEAFTNVAAAEPRIRSVQPGYYQLRLRMSGASAVTLLLDPAARVGRLEIRGGVQLDDTSAPDGTVAPGVLSLISKATCDGDGKCVPVPDLRAAMAKTDPATLGVPSWALDDVAKAEPTRRLEGLLVPGLYDLEPGTPALAVLQGLLATSSARLEAAGLVSGAQSIGSTPYQLLVLASLVEKEGITPDMPKVARVIYNRLGAGQRLELDSTVNYPLDLQALRTSASNRQKPGPYNSYANTGLPPTPIAAAGSASIQAAMAPSAGPWFFFVRCQKDGTSCFAVTLAEHQANVAEAEENGAI